MYNMKISFKVTLEDQTKWWYKGFCKPKSPSKMLVNI